MMTLSFSWIAVICIIVFIAGFYSSRALGIPFDTESAFRLLLKNLLKQADQEFDKIPNGNKKGAADLKRRTHESIQALKDAYKSLVPWEDFQQTFSDTLKLAKWLRFSEGFEEGADNSGTSDSQ